MTEYKWETKSLEWIHKVREDLESEIREKGMTPVEWIRSRGEIDFDAFCKKFGLKNCKKAEGRFKK